MASIRAGLTPDHLALALAMPGVAGAQGVNVMLWGRSGAGKSALTAAVAAQYGLEPVEFILGVVEPEDIAGLPVPGAGEAFRRQVDPRLERAAHAGHILVFDDFTSAPPAVQAATLRVLLEREVAGLDLSRTPMVATANPRDAGGLYALLPAAANRFLHLQMDDVTARRFLEHAFAEDAQGRLCMSSVAREELERNWASSLERAWDGYRRFFSKAPRHLLVGDPPTRIEGAEEAAYPTHRSWEMAVLATAACWAVRLDPRPMVEGCVGRLAAAAALDSLASRTGGAGAALRAALEPRRSSSPRWSTADYLAAAAAAEGLDGTSGLPVVAWGGVGTGKSSSARRVLEAMGLRSRTIVLGTWLPTDLGGIPIPATDGPSFHRQVDPVLAEVSRPGWGLVIDDLTFATPATQNAALDLILRRRAGTVDLSRTPIVVTANPASSGGMHELTAPMANRLLHLPAGDDGGRRWLLGETPEAGVRADLVGVRRLFQDELARAQVAVEGYLRARPPDLSRDPVSDRPDGGYDYAFPSPRTWELAARALAACRAAGLPPLPLVCAALGEEVGSLFTQWDVDHPLPSPSDVLAGRVDWSCLRPDEALAAAKAAALSATGVDDVAALVREGRRCQAQNAPDIFAPAFRVLRRRLLEASLPAAVAPEVSRAMTELAGAAGAR